MPHKKVKKLVIDTSAFIKLVPLWEMAEEFYTVTDVFHEVREKAARDWIKTFPYPIIYEEPLPEHIKFINEFTKKTGDYSSLSITDTKVLALTYKLELEANGDSKVRKAPLSIEIRRTQIASPSNPNLIDMQNEVKGFYLPSKKDKNVAAQHCNSILLLPIEGHIDGPLELSAECITQTFLEFVDTYLANQSYIFLAIPTSLDVEMFININECLNQLDTRSDSSLESVRRNENIKRDIFSSLPHLKRYLSQMESYSAEEICSFPKYNISWEDLIDFIKDRPFDAGDERTDEQSKKVQSDQKTVTSLESHLECLILTDQDSVVSPDVATRDALTGDFSDSKAGLSDDSGQGELCSESEYSDEELADEGGESDDDGWITPSNIKISKEEDEQDDIEKAVEVACISADFSVQNVLKHIGLHLLGVDGKLIKQINTFILRCYACYKTTTKMDRLFCPHCGHKTLKRVSVTLNPDGSQNIWINTKRPINTRGTKFSLPRPRGGKHAVFSLVVADQRIPCQKPSSMYLKKNDPLDPDWVSGVSPFMVRDVYSRASQLGIRSGPRGHKGVYYWEKKNPNETHKKGGSKKKKRN